MSHLGIAVRDLMERQGLTALEVGERAGLHRNTIGVILRGVFLPARTSTVGKLAVALGVTREWLQSQIDKDLAEEKARIKT